MTARPLVWLSLAILAIAAVGAGTWYAFVRSGSAAPEAQTPTPDPTPPDPRLTFPIPFRNVRPGVRYVGDAACAGCHAGIDRTFHEHPMGRSAELVTRAAPIERYDAAAKDPFTVGPFELRVEKDGITVRHRTSAKGPAAHPLPDYVCTADVAIGSGARGRTYLSVESGSVWESPVSWFSHESRWDLSPGLEPHSRRAVTPECLLCHTNHVEPIPGATNRYKEPLFPGQVAIGCERCHGPGELHVAEQSAGQVSGGIDTGIVNPRHLDTELRGDICRQCHLQGRERVARRGRSQDEYRPGLPLEQFVSVFVPRSDPSRPNRSVSQFEQMEASRCFAGSGGKLGCTSCHDPHARPAPAAADEFYRGRCLTCHASKGCSLPAGERKAKNDSCVTCHMPRAGSGNIAHTAVTDHTVPRRPGGHRPAAGQPPGDLPLVPYRPGPHAPPPAERDRDYGLALARFALQVPPPDQRPVARAAEERLRAALAAQPGDAEAWGALSSALGMRGAAADMVEAARTATALTPDSEPRLEDLVWATMAVGDFDQAVRAADRLVGMSPRSAGHRDARALALTGQRRWEEAEAECRAALAIQPLEPSVRLLLAACRSHLGDPAGARAESEAAFGLARDPDQRAGFERWYRRHAR